MTQQAMHHWAESLLCADVPRLGAIPSGLPQFRLPAVPQSMWPQVAQAALMLAALGAIDSLLTSLVADQLTQDYHDSDKELVGQVAIGLLLLSLSLIPISIQLLEVFLLVVSCPSSHVTGVIGILVWCNNFSLASG